MKKFDVSVGFVLVNDNKQFLLLKKAVDGVWDFPKGHFNEGETDERLVAYRELEEETSINKKCLRVVEGFRRTMTFRNPVGVDRKLVLFLAFCNEEPLLSAEHTEYRWVDVKEAKKLLFFDEKKKLIDGAYKRIRNI